MIPANHLERGVRFRSRRQMPVLAGSDDSVRNIVGSVRQLRIDRGRLTGSLRWCDDQAAAAVRAKYDAGILSLNLEIAQMGAGTWQPICARLVASSGGAEQ